MSQNNNSNNGLLFFVGSLLISGALGFFVWNTLKKGHSAENGAEVHLDKDVEKLFAISGSNTIGDKLMPEIVKAFFIKKGYTNVEIQAGDNAEHKFVIAEKDGKKVAIDVHAEGSGEAFKELLQGTTAIGMSSRPINETEVGMLSNVGDMHSPSCEHVLAMDGIAIIVPGSNSLKNMTKMQLSNIFSGNINNWSQIIEGKAGAINLYVRDDKSGTYETFKTLVMNGSNISGQAKTFKNSQELSNSLANDPNGIGFVALPFVGNNKTLAVAADDGITPFYPNALTIATEDYALSRRLYLYKGSNQKEPLVNELMEFALSDEGQKIVGQNGYIGLDIKASADASRNLGNTTIPDAYKKATAGAARENFNIHFLSGSSQIDNKAFGDINRLSRQLALPQYQNKQVVLLGFTDDQGEDAANVKLALARANAVANNLKSLGIANSQTIGMGEIMPISSNKTAEGKEKNRRVEVWLK